MVMLFVGCDSDRKGPAAAKDSTARADSGIEGTAAEVVSEFQEGTPVVDANTRFSFKLAPRVGDQYRYRITQKTSKQMNTLNGKEEKVFNFTARIAEINSDSSISVEMRFDSIRVTQTAPASPKDSTMRTLSYDTRRPPDTAIAGSKEIRALIGHKVNVTIAHTGAISDVSNVDPIISAIVGNMRDSIPPQQLAFIRDGIKVQYFGLPLQELFLRFVPDTGVTAGAEWRRRDTLPMAGIKSKSTFSYHLVEVKKVDDATRGRLTMALAAEVPKEKVENQGLSTQINDSKIAGSGEGVYNLTTGFPVHKKTVIEQSMNYTVTATAGPRKGASQTVTEKESSNVVVELLEFKPGGGQ